MGLPPSAPKADVYTDSTTTAGGRNIRDPEPREGRAWARDRLTSLESPPVQLPRLSYEVHRHASALRLHHAAQFGLEHAPYEVADHSLVVDHERGSRRGAHPTRTPSRRSNSFRTIW